MSSVSPVWPEVQPRVASATGSISKSIAASVALLMALAGCGSTQPERTWLSLPLELGAPSTSTTATTALTPTPPSRALPPIRLLRVQIPEYLQSNHVRYRDSASTLAEWPGVRWAERLEMALTRQLGLQLHELGEAGWICEDPCHTQSEGGNLQVSYAALDFDRAQARLHARALWTLSPAPGSAGTLQQGQLRLSEAVREDSPAGQAAAMAQVNAAVARNIAQQLRP